MDNSAPNQNEDQSPTLDESDILPLKAEDRTADNPMGTVLNFLGLAVMADLTVDALETVGSMGGGLALPEMLNSEIAPEMAAELTVNMESTIENAMDIMAPTTPTFTA